jgi:hypothetical protein
MMQISRAPSSASSGKFFLRRSRVMYAWARARGLWRCGGARGGQREGLDKQIFLRDDAESENAIIGVCVDARLREARARVESPRAFRARRAGRHLGRATYLPRVPILTMGSSTSATTRMAPRDLTEALTRLAALGIAAEKEEERALIFLPDAAGATRAETAAADIMAAIVM